VLRQLNERHPEEVIMKDPPQPEIFGADDEIDKDAFLNHHPGRKYFDADGEIDIREYGLMLNAIMWIGVMAAPKIWASLRHVPPKAHLLTLLDGYLPYAYSKRYAVSVQDGETRVDTSQRGPLATRLRELLEQWEPPQMTAEIRETARLLLLADGDQKPPCGWDEFTLEPNFPYEELILGPDGFNQE
jgi:hypothetical protein